MKLYSKYKCYCGFENVITFNKPNTVTKQWLESECLDCGARYDIRIYPHSDKSQINIHKRVIKMSVKVQEAIDKEAKEKANFKYNNDGVLSGEEITRKNKSNKII